MSKKTFANSMEYQNFLENFCDNCIHCTVIDDAGNTTCPIENALSRAVFDKDQFPYKQVYLQTDTENKLSRWTCTEFQAKPKNPWLRYPGYKD